MFLRWLRERYDETVTSIAFMPAIIAIGFLLLSYLSILFDFSETGMNIKASSHFLSLKDAGTARSICSSIVSGILSLVVFSFTLVMLLLNQSASQLSNRILGKLIGNRFQQVVLGFYIGTIIYALFLLSTIRDIDSGIYVPAISTYLLIALTIVDIFLFIYFLHYITNSVKYETIIVKVHKETRAELVSACNNDYPREEISIDGRDVYAHHSGRLQGHGGPSLIEFCVKHDAQIQILKPVGDYVLQGTPFAKAVFFKNVDKDIVDKIQHYFDIESGQEIRTHYYYGCRQLMEIAIKALSPGINDPDTAVISFQVICDLLLYRMKNHPETHFFDNNKKLRIIIAERSFDDMFAICVLPIWDYGKNDIIIQNEMATMLAQMLTVGEEPMVRKLYEEVMIKIAE